VAGLAALAVQDEALFRPNMSIMVTALQPLLQAEFEDAGHSKDGSELDPMPTDIPELEIISSKNEPADYGHKFMDLTKQYWAVPVAVVGISVVAGFLYLRKE